MSESMKKLAEAYQSIGEFVVTFQWVENKYREIGWFILDPSRNNWPPTELRKETNAELINKVTKMFLELTNKYKFPNGAERAEDFRGLGTIFHDLRQFRNRLVHSTYLMLEAGGEVQGMVRSNPKTRVDDETGEIIFDQEFFSERVVDEKLKEVGDAVLRLSGYYIQLIHWHPFERFS